MHWHSWQNYRTGKKKYWFNAVVPFLYILSHAQVLPHTFKLCSFLLLCVLCFISFFFFLSGSCTNSSCACMLWSQREWGHNPMCKKVCLFSTLASSQREYNSWGSLLSIRSIGHSGANIACVQYAKNYKWVCCGVYRVLKYTAQFIGPSHLLFLYILTHTRTHTLAPADWRPPKQLAKLIGQFIRPTHTHTQKHTWREFIEEGIKIETA